MTEDEQFWVRFWGVRGTVACPGPDTLKYGGNTSCLEVRCGDRQLIFDAGTGLRALGNTLCQQNLATSGHVFLTHTHIDHISGLPFFRPAYSGCNRFEFWSGHLKRQGRRLQEVLDGMMQPPFFPVPLDIMHACVCFHDFEAGETLRLFPGVELQTIPLNHPGGATGYRINFRDKSICYVTDTEHFEGRRDATILGLIENSDILIYDATYTDSEYPSFRGWGHSTWQEGVRLCREANVKRLATFHHDPEHDDRFLDGIALELEEAMPGSVVSREGMTLVP